MSHDLQKEWPSPEAIEAPVEPGANESAPRGFVGSAVLRALRYLVLASRPVGWIASVGLYRIGLAYAEAPDTVGTWVVTAALSWPFCLYLFGLNDHSDAASDRLNPRKGNWIHGASAPYSETRWARAAPWAAGAVVLLSAMALPWRASAIVAAVLVIGWMYSARPLRLKEVPIIDGLVTAAIMIGLLGAGYASGASLQDIPVESYAVAPTLAGLHIFASVVDVASDREAGHKTLAVRAGPRAAGIVALALSLLSAATVPVLDYAPAISAYVLFQPSAFAASLLLPRWVSGRRALVVVGVAGVATLLYLSLVYLR